MSTSGYYDWVRAQVNPWQRRRRDAELTVTIREIHSVPRHLRAPRVHAELRLVGAGIPGVVWRDDESLATLSVSTEVPAGERGE